MGLSQHSVTNVCHAILSYCWTCSTERLDDLIWSPKRKNKSRHPVLRSDWRQQHLMGQGQPKWSTNHCDSRRSSVDERSVCACSRSFKHSEKAPVLWRFISFVNALFCCCCCCCHKTLLLAFRRLPARVVPKLWYVYQWWYAKAFKVVHECSLLSLLVSKNGHNSFSQPFSSCCICVNSGFANFWSNVFVTMSFSGTRWYVVTVRDPQMLCDQKKFGNHWSTLCNTNLGVQIKPITFGGMARASNTRKKFSKK